MAWDTIFTPVLRHISHSKIVLIYKISDSFWKRFSEKNQIIHIKNSHLFNFSVQCDCNCLLFGRHSYKSLKDAHCKIMKAPHFEIRSVIKLKLFYIKSLEFLQFMWYLWLNFVVYLCFVTNMRKKRTCFILSKYKKKIVQFYRRCLWIVLLCALHKSSSKYSGYHSLIQFISPSLITVNSAVHLYVTAKTK